MFPSPVGYDHGPETLDARDHQRSVGDGGFEVSVSYQRKLKCGLLWEYAKQKRAVLGISTRTGAMTRWLGALAALPEDQGSIPSTHTEAHTPSVTPAPGDLMPSSGLWRH